MHRKSLEYANRIHLQISVCLAASKSSIDGRILRPYCRRLGCDVLRGRPWNRLSREDTLSSIQAVLFGLAALLSFAYFPLALTTAKARQWTQASILAIVVATPLAIFLASEGLLSHYLWWGPISDTDRFHMLHHSLVAAVPLSIIYFLFLRWRWRPNLLTELGHSNSQDSLDQCRGSKLHCDPTRHPCGWLADGNPPVSRCPDRRNRLRPVSSFGGLTTRWRCTHLSAKLH